MNQTKQSSKRRLSNREVSEILLTNKIKHDVKLLALANKQKAEGKKDLAEFILAKSEKGLQEQISTTWKMNAADSTIHRESRSRMEIIRQKSVNGECAEDCEGEWLRCANQVLRRNDIHHYVFATAVKDLMQKGRGKFHNIMTLGPANCGKTFLLSPFTCIY